MKASFPNDEDFEGEEAETEFELDYENFFSVLMYYGHMSKDDIMHSSRLFLSGIYRQYINRARENLGVSDKNPEDETENDYPTEFFKLPMKDREETLKEFSGTEDFMSMFGEASKYDKGMFQRLDEQKGEN